MRRPTLPVGLFDLVSYLRAMPRPALSPAAALIVAVVTTSCGGDSEGPAERPSPTAANSPVQVQVVNYELVTGQPERFIVGLILPDNRLVAYGAVQMRFAPIDEAGQPTGPASEVVQGTYLPVPGTDQGEPSMDPQAISPSTARGVYEIEGANFAQPGSWVVSVAARVEGVGVVEGSAQFAVVAEPEVPGVGERAPRSDNPVLGDDVPVESVDSRAVNDGTVPDPVLHRTSIAEAIERGKPTIVVFSTPVYCTSRFCGPVTDMVEDLESDYGDQATFIHVEIWEDFERNAITPTASEWLLRGDTLNEPWLFMIDRNGRIAARWDNLFTRPELEDGLEELLR